MQFHKGDKVRRINEDWYDIKVGDEGIVAEHDMTQSFGGGTLRLEGHYKTARGQEGQLEGYMADNFELVPAFNPGDKVRSKAFGGDGTAILAYFPNPTEARKEYGIAAGDSEGAVVIYNVSTNYSGSQQVSWDFASSVELVERAKPEPVKPDYSELLGLADNLIFAYGITDPNGHTGDVLTQLAAALREETSNDNA